MSEILVYAILTRSLCAAPIYQMKNVPVARHKWRWMCAREGERERENADMEIGTTVVALSVMANESQEQLRNMK